MSRADGAPARGGQGAAAGPQADGAPARGGQGAAAGPQADGAARRAGAGGPACPAVEMKVCGEGASCPPGRRNRGYRGGGDKWRFKGGSRVRVLSKLDVSQVRWIVREKAKGEMTNGAIAEAMHVSVRTVQYLWARFRYTRPDDIVYPARTGRPQDDLPGRREHGAVVGLHAQCRTGAARLEGCIERKSGLHIPHNTIHDILKDDNLAVTQPKKSKRRKWIRWERSHSNMMWHTDFKQLKDGRWFLGYGDDAARKIVGHGIFEHATSENALAVLDAAIKTHGKPASIMSDHGIQFYASESETHRRGRTKFEMRLEDLGIKHILARVRHPQTNGKIERFHEEIERHLGGFEAASAAVSTRCRPDGAAGHVGGPFHQDGPKDAMTRLVEWYNEDRPHMSLDEGETPSMAYIRKMPPRGQRVIDEQSGDVYEAR